MATDSYIASLQEILQDLNTHIEGLEQILIMQQDGTLLAQFNPKEQQSDVEGILAEFAGLTEDVCQVLERGANTEAIIKGQKRFLALYRCHKMNILLGIVGQATVNFGLLNSGARIAIQKIEKLSTG